MGSNKVLEIRHKLAMTQEDFASKIGISQTTISRYESQDIQPSFQTCKKIVRLANAKGIKINIEDVRPD